MMKNLSGQRVLHDGVVDHLGGRIVRGELAPGTLLPVEAELGEIYAVSRAVVREAIKALSAKGLVEVRRKLGTRVSPRRQWRWFDPDVLAWSSSGASDREFLRSLTDVRRIIEPGAARLAALRADDADRRQLQAAYDEMAATGGADLDRFIEADLRFHASLLDGCHNLLLLALTDAVDLALRASREVTVRRGGSHEDSLAAHQAVLDGVLSRRPDAAELAMASLIDRTARDIESVFTQDHEMRTT